MAKFRITQTTPYDSQGSLVVSCQKSQQIPTESPQMGAPNKSGVGSNGQFSTNISQYLRNSAR